MHSCYCEGYGTCFGSEGAFHRWHSQMEALEGRWGKHLRAKSAGKETLQLKKQLVDEREFLDQVLQQAKNNWRHGDMING